MKISPFLMICSILFFISTIYLQVSFLDKRYGTLNILPSCPWCENEDSTGDVVYIPISSPIMRLLAPADRHFLADLLWMRTVYYFGKHSLTDRKFPYLLHLLDLITDLSPQWVEPYIFGALILPMDVTTEDGIYIIDKGLVHHEDNWRLWFYKGYYLWRIYKDYLSAAEAFKKASVLPGAPSYLIRLSATFATKAGQKELAVRFLTEALDKIDDPAERKILMKKLKEVLEGAKDGSRIE